MLSIEVEDYVNLLRGKEGLWDCAYHLMSNKIKDM